MVIYQPTGIFWDKISYPIVLLLFPTQHMRFHWNWILFPWFNMISHDFPWFPSTSPLKSLMFPIFFLCPMKMFDFLVAPTQIFSQIFPWNSDFPKICRKKYKTGIPKVVAKQKARAAKQKLDVGLEDQSLGSKNTGFSSEKWWFFYIFPGKMRIELPRKMIKNKDFMRLSWWFNGRMG